MDKLYKVPHHNRLHQNPADSSYAGHALLTALFIMTLVAIVATAMTLRIQQDISRARLIINYDRLKLASEFATFWAMDRLSMKQLPQHPLNDEGKILELPNNYQAIVPNILINSEIYDLQAHFNLNNLQTKSGQATFEALLKQVFETWRPSMRRELIQSIAYWISPYHPDRGVDDELKYYLNLKPAYLPGYQFLQTSSELRMIRGINAKKYRKLKPYITTLPEQTPINLYTASKPILKALNPHLTDEQLERLNQLKYSKKKHSPSYLEKLLKQMGIDKNAITTDSNYFLCVTTSESAGDTQTQYTVLKRHKKKNKKIKVTVIQQSVNTLDFFPNLPTQ